MCIAKSHLLQMRGLKLNDEMQQKKIKVASFTDAWIETEVIQRLYVFLPVASFTDAWIETPRSACTTRFATSHLLQMRGLKLLGGLRKNSYASRIFYRCVD